MGKGVDVLIEVEGPTTGTFVAVGGQRNATLSESADTIDVTSKDSAGAYEYEYGLTGWTISCDGVHVKDDAAYILLRDALRNKKKVKVNVKDGASVTSTGTALVTSNEFEGPYDGESTYSLELTGSGKLTSGA